MNNRVFVRAICPPRVSSGAFLARHAQLKPRVAVLPSSAMSECNNVDPMQALRRSEERCSAFIRNSSEAIWLFELEEPVPTTLSPAAQIDAFYRLAYLAECNEAMAQLYGYERPDELIGIRLGALMPRNDPANIAYLEAFIAADHQLKDAESVEITKEGQEVVISFGYRKEVPLFHNIGLFVDFAGDS